MKCGLYWSCSKRSLFLQVLPSLDRNQQAVLRCPCIWLRLYSLIACPSGLSLSSSYRNNRIRQYCFDCLCFISGLHHFCWVVIIIWFPFPLWFFTFDSFSLYGFNSLDRWCHQDTYWSTFFHLHSLRVPSWCHHPYFAPCLRSYLFMSYLASYQYCFAFWLLCYSKV